MKKVDFKDLKNLKGKESGNPLVRDEQAMMEATKTELAPVFSGRRTRISVDVDETTLKKLNAITMNRQLASGNIIARASVVRDLIMESIERHYNSKT